MEPVRRHAYKAEFKLLAISHALEFGNRAAAKKFKINESMIRKWRKQEDQLRRVKKTTQSFRGNKAKWPELEEKIKEWFLDQKKEGANVSTVSIQLKAIEIAHDMNIEDFQGGASWCFRFMRRHNISIRTKSSISQQLPKDYKETMFIFLTYCKNKILEKNILADHITNMDEVPLTFDIPTNCTLDKTDIHTISIGSEGNEKLSFTVVLSCQANGHKLLPMVIFKRNTLPTENFPTGVIVKFNSKGCMDNDTMKEWLREVYIKRPDSFSPIYPFLLIFDSLRPHLTNTIKKEVEQTNSELAIIPGGLTKKLQPLDIGVKKAFKIKIQAAWELWITEGKQEFAKTGRQLQVSYAAICRWILDAWTDVSDLTVVQSFKKAGIIGEEPIADKTEIKIEICSDNDESDLGSCNGEGEFDLDNEDERNLDMPNADIVQLLTPETKFEEDKC